MPKRVLIAGASGTVGFHLIRLAHQQGLWVRTLSQSRWRAPKVSLFADDLWMRNATQEGAIRGICNRVDTVISCMGGGLQLHAPGMRSVPDNCLKANLNLLAEAKEAEVGRFVYLSAFGQQQMENTAFVRAHRRFEKELRASGLKFTILRITETFASFDTLVEMARKGRVPLIGRGDARVNPIHPEDAALLCLQSAFLGPEVVEAGGPEVLTRREIAQQIFQSMGEEPHLYRVPAFILRLTGSLTRPFNQRTAHLLEFLPAVSVSDAIAPAYGKRLLAEYLRELTGASSLATARVA